MEKSQGLIITLIVFIIISLGLGVVSYFMSQGYKETTVKFNESEEKLKKAEGEIRTLNGNLDKVKEKIGYPALNPDELLTEMDKSLQDAKGDLTDVPKDYKGALEELARNAQSKSAELIEAQRQRDDYMAKLEEANKTMQAQKEEFDAKVASLDADFKTQIAAAASRNDELNARNEKLVKEVDDIKIEAKKTNEAERVKVADANETAAAIAEINVSLRDKLDQMTRADFDVPDGKIIYVDQQNKKVRLNIGRAEDLRLLTTFGVFPFNALESGELKSKGSIEIVRIIGEHESEGRILSDEMLNPVLPGDLLYTPLWKSGDTVKFALDYYLDIDNDGVSDLDTLVNLIRSSGSEVAAWIDENGDIKGEITPDVTYMIVGNEEIIGLLENDHSKSQDVKDKIQKSHMNMIEQCRNNSVHEVRLSEFLRRVNYRNIADVDRYQEEGGVRTNRSGPTSPVVSKSYVAPIYTPGEKDEPPVSHGILAPIYDKKNKQQAVESQGRVSDYYFRPRNPSGL